MILPSSFHLAVMGSNAPLSAIALMPALNLAKKFCVFLANAKANALSEDFNIERNSALQFAAG